MSGLRKKAFGFCNRGGFRYKLSEFKTEVVNFAGTGLMVCPYCWDDDHPQNHLGTLKSGDSQSLKDPRPDRGLEDSRTIISSAWNVDDGDYTGQTWEDFINGD